MTAILFPDPRLALLEVLVPLLAERDEPYAQGVRVSAEDPPRGQGARRPWVRLSVDGRVRDARLNGRATIRVAVWHSTEEDGEALAALIEALLLDAAHTADLRGCSPLVGPMPTGDPDTGEPLSYFTVTARLRPSNLT